MSEERRSVSISGSGRLGGGEYARVTISGSGRIDGDLRAEELRISGSGRVSGRTEAGKIAVSGSARFAGPVRAEELRISGSARVEGAVEAEELRSSGSFSIDGDIATDYLKSSGSLRVGGDVEADIFKATGAMEVAGLLSADKVEIHLAGRCSAREIGGEQIRVDRPESFGAALLGGLARMLTGGGVAELRVTLVEGDDVRLAHTIADVVRGTRVEIGPGCKIGSVEYAEELEVHDDATVERHRKL